MDKSKWFITDYKEEYMQKLILLTQKYYGNIEITSEEFLKWQYFKNPRGKCLIKLAQNEEGTIIGQYIIIPINFKIYDRNVVGTLSLNTLVDSDYQGRGIFTKLASEVYNEAREKNIEFTFGFPNPNSFYGFTKKLAFIYTEIPLLTAIINPLKIPVNFFIKRKNEENFNIRAMSFDGVLIQSVEKFDNSFDDFWERVKDKYKVLVVRESKYLNWRYKEIPYRSYYTLKAELNKKILAYVIFRITTIKGIRCCVIVDFLMENSDIGVKAGGKLIYCVKNYIKKANVNICGAIMMEHTNEFQLLKRNKFFNCPKNLLPQPVIMILKKHGDDNSSVLYDFKNWFVTMGDYDVI